MGQNRAVSLVQDALFRCMFWLLERGLCNFIYGLLNKLKKQTLIWFSDRKKVEECQKKNREIMAQNPCSTTIGNPLPKS